jgi:predicted DNA-binding transcriptional regulator AlpA
MPRAAAEIVDLQSAEPRRPVLPSALPPRGLNRVQASAYVGISPNTFDRLVAEGRMPRAKRIFGRKVWDRLALDEAFAALPDDVSRDGLEGSGPNPWDD